MLENRKEIDEKLHDIEDKEQLQDDCTYIQNIKNNIRNTSINRLEELRVEFIKNNNIHREEQVIVNRIFKFLKDKEKA
jgi:hypothetical protein